MTNRPVGLMWYVVAFRSKSSAGMVGSITSAMIASRICALVTLSACCVETTTVSTRTGRPPSYAMVTCALPSGRSHGSEPLFRHSARRRVSRCASTIGIGMSSAVSSVA